MVEKMKGLIEYFKRKKETSCKEEKRKIKSCIEVEVGAKEEVITPYLVNGKSSINLEFANLLDNIGKSVNPNQDFCFYIKGKKWNDEDKFDVASAIKNYYHNTLVQMNRKLKSNLKLFLLMVFLSVFSVGTLFLAEYFGAPFIITEVIDIVVWGFVWESVDLATFQRSFYQHEYEHNKAIYNMKILFK